MSEELINSIVSDKHRQVCFNIVSGMSQTAAYQTVYPDSSEAAASSSCSDLLNNPKIKVYINDLRNRIESEQVMSFHEKRKFLKEVKDCKVGELTADSHLAQEIKIDVAMDGQETITIKIPSKLEAIKVDNAMMGHNAKVEVEVTAFSTILKAISGTTEGLPSEEEKQQLRDMKQAERIDDKE